MIECWIIFSETIVSGKDRWKELFRLWSIMMINWKCGGKRIQEGNGMRITRGGLKSWWKKKKENEKISKLEWSKIKTREVEVTSSN